MYLYVDVGLYTLDRMWVTRDHAPKGINWGPCFSRLEGSLLWTALLLSHFQDKRAPHIKTSWILLPVSHMRIQSRYNQMSQFINLYKWNPKVEGLSVFVMTNRRAELNLIFTAVTLLIVVAFRWPGEPWRGISATVREMNHGKQLLKNGWTW